MPAQGISKNFGGGKSLKKVDVFIGYIVASKGKIQKAVPDRVCLWVSGRYVKTKARELLIGSIILL
jgi:hypothetical protein